VARDQTARHSIEDRLFRLRTRKTHSQKAQPNEASNANVRGSTFALNWFEKKKDATEISHRVFGLRQFHAPRSFDAIEDQLTYDVPRLAMLAPSRVHKQKISFNDGRMPRMQVDGRHRDVHPRRTAAIRERKKNRRDTGGHAVRT